MVASGEPVTALGLMSGTSMDGVDAALVRTDGETVSAFLRSEFIPYTNDQRVILRAGLGLWPDDNPKLQAEVENVVHRVHKDIIHHFSDLHVVGFHGQTLAHDPKGRRTFQVGQGERLARETRNRVVWDFRTRDMQDGGEGAPMAPFFHFSAAKWSAAAEPVAFLNLGGVANVTWVDPAKAQPEEAGALMAFDTGPANALIDDFVRRRTGRRFDKSGELARAGKPDSAVLEAMGCSEYFSRTPPKSLDRNGFRDALDAVQHLADADGAATLTAFSADCIARGMGFFPSRPSAWLVCGGGRKNVTLMRMISERTQVETRPVESIGLDGDMLEAQAFAYLAVRVLRGLPTSSPSTTGCKFPVCGGIISKP